MRHVLDVSRQSGLGINSMYQGKVDEACTECIKAKWIRHELNVARQSGLGMNLWMYQGNSEGRLTGVSHELVEVSRQCR